MNRQKPTSEADRAHDQVSPIRPWRPVAGPATAMDAPVQDGTQGFFTALTTLRQRYHLDITPTSDGAGSDVDEHSLDDLLDTLRDPTTGRPVD